MILSPPSHSPARDAWLLGLLWFLLVAITLAVRPLLPVDETRYVSVAWEMWQRGDWLVPFKNGEPYAHKPPLLFWLMQAGWALFGVNEWWPRLLGSLAALGSLLLMRRLARELWPTQVAVGWTASWLLFASLFWLAFITLVQFDVLLVLATLLAMLGWWRTGQGQRLNLWPGLAIGLGVLIKGPVILLHVLPVALLAPLWLSPAWSRWRWYGLVVLNSLLGAAIGLAWAIPAGIAGGEAYREAIFWGQTANRVVDSFAHQQPWWWYLPLLPLLMLPWIVWPPLWQGLRQHVRWRDPAILFLLAWLVPVLMAFSLVSGKQLKYLLPLLPALVLLFSYAVAGLSLSGRRSWLAGAICILAGGVLVSLPLWLSEKAASWLFQVEPGWGGLLILAGLLFWLLKPVELAWQLRRMAIASVLVVAIGQLALMQAGAYRYDLTSISQRIATLQAAGHPVAHIGDYHAQFHFLGRLTAPLEEVLLPRQHAVAWARAHPQGYLVVYRSAWPQLAQSGALYEQDFRGRERELGLWRAPDFMAALPKRLIKQKRNNKRSRRR